MMNVLILRARTKAAALFDGVSTLRAGAAAVWAVATLLTLATDTRAQPAPLVLKAGIGLKADTPQGRGMAYFAQLVESRSQGRVKIDLHTGGALGDDLTMIDKLRRGELAITCPDSSTLASSVSGFSVINYPFTFISESEADHVLDGAWGKALLDRLPGGGLVGLAYWENGFRHLTNSQRALPDLAAASGLRLRTMQNQMLIDSFRTLGFDAVPMPFPKVYDALASGQVHGQENPLPTILSSRFYEVQKHLTLSRHVYSTFVFLVSKQTWDSLAPQDRQLLLQAVQDARDAQRRWNREVTKDALEQLKARGMLVTSIPVRESERVRNRLRSVLDEHNRNVGEASVIAMYIELARLRSAAPLAKAGG